MKPGDQVVFGITNYGSIAAQDLVFDLPEANGIRFIPLSDEPIGSVPANTMLYFPVNIDTADASSRQLSTRRCSSCVSGPASWYIRCRGRESSAVEIGYVVGERAKCSSRLPGSVGSGRLGLHATTPARAGFVIGCECGISILLCIESFVMSSVSLLRHLFAVLSYLSSQYVLVEVSTAVLFLFHAKFRTTARRKCPVSTNVPEESK